MFVTMFIGVLDLKSGHLRYCNAGHDAPMLIGRGVGTLPCIPNLPVGVIPDMKFVLQEDEIDRNTTIFLYTDGLNEAEDNTHAQFGMERIKALAESLLLQKQHQPERLINAMTDAVHQFVGDAERSDDLTMLAIQLKTTS
jgi:sigma-B regulation protein RsbU (phosphoserine phosphatase)